LNTLERKTDAASLHDPLPSARKLKTIDQLADIVATIKAEGKTVVHCHGVFDLLHPGHIRHLVEAAGQGDSLIVTITADAGVFKGPGRPIFNHSLRAETLASLEVVDYVAVNDAPNAVDAIKKIKPDVYVKGSDYIDPEKDVSGKISEEAETVRSFGGRVHFTDDITFSSSSLINQNFSVFPPEVDKWLSEFRAKYTEDEVVSVLEDISDMSVLVIGEAIIDEYVYCTGLGKAAKDPILAFLNRSMEQFAGGSYAVANHLGDFCKSVECITLMGEVDKYEKFVSESLHPNISRYSVTHTGAPTVRKRRFVDQHTGAKIFELYFMDDSPLDEKTEQGMLKTVEERIKKADVVIVADYGHGMMTPALIDLLTKKSKFLVVNTQANAGNFGFNSISKYPKADYVCLAGNEMELEIRRKHASPRENLLEMTEVIDCSRFTVTLGRQGTIHYETGIGFSQAPALATQVVDRVGAGDAVLAVTGMLVAAGVPWEIVAFIANAVGAEMVGELGNRHSMSKVGLSKHLSALLK